jgi:hypothetical protein
MPAPNITPLPTPPSRSTDPTNFAIEADAFVAALPDFATEANAQADYLDDLAAAVDADAAIAEASASIATGAANYQGDYNAGTTYQIGESVSYSGRRYVAKTVNTGVTPVDGVNWLIINDGDVSGPSSATANGIALYDGTTGKIIKAGPAPSTAGNVLISDGTNWTSSAPPVSEVQYPQNVQSGDYTLVLDDAGKQIYSANTGAQTITIPTNASVAFPIGTVITVVNEGNTKIVLSRSGVDIKQNNANTPVYLPEVLVGAAVQLLKIGTNSWKATFGVITAGVVTVPLQYLVIAGGGSGSTGGGGAGGYLTNTANFSVGTSSITVTVGAGGASGTNGVNSVLAGSTTVTTTGGGASGGFGHVGNDGGSGGGGVGNTGPTSAAGGLGVAGQGNNGGSGLDRRGGGGGGAGAVGGNVSGTVCGNGGNGLSSSITGAAVTRGGGGGGGFAISGTNGSGGTGGGGAGGVAANGTANTGGGGGGGSFGLAGNGGSGVVIIRVATSSAATSTTGSPTITTNGSDTIYVFNSSGTITW